MSALTKRFNRFQDFDFHAALGIGKNKACDHLLVTCLDLTGSVDTVCVRPQTVFTAALDRTAEANEVLNRLSGWMVHNAAMDQARYNSDRRNFNFGFFRLGVDMPHAPPLLNDVFLEDFVFPDRHPSQAHGFDDLMRMLDRDRLGEAMRGILEQDFELPVNPNAPLFWRRELRICCHPDKRREQEAFISLRAPRAPIPIS